MKKSVTFKSNGLDVKGDLYVPDDYQAGQKLPAIVVSHPFGGVKEQTAGLYAQKLCMKGNVTLAFDASYQGESAGEPRFLEDPFARAEDIRSAVTFLGTADEVDPARIGALGICASGGYVPFTAATDHRIRAVATVSAADMGSLFRDGLGGNGDAELRDGLLEAAAQDRTDQAHGKPARLEHIVPDTPAEVTEDTPALYAEGTDYYRTPRAQHPNAQNWYVVAGLDRIMAYGSFDHVDLISPRPLLMIAGTRADTKYCSEQAYAQAKEPKELYLVDGASHVDLYDKPEYVTPAVERLDAFFDKHLAAA
ncbi:hypothetical protein Cme02nite_02310 [Catellatospora methionotrophica]|uniref:Xaa-Pro dipeptidyl-peptidase-like domain-containing protein n=1 Tax=Catellatospora methionotrophica TaxID=121620 RepID=A0A8J3PCR2_9ACTN|nr:alpha/beta hydrolase [Catellatospora methionotrophica]GIG11899.1 hypothetical protein Cme02nite_02310 [Catellatospora methionotrophica]